MTFYVSPVYELVLYTPAPVDDTDELLWVLRLLGVMYAERPSR